MARDVIYTFTATDSQGNTSSVSQTVQVGQSTGGSVASGHLIPAGYPTPDTTGWRGFGMAESDLTYHAGSLATTANGQVITGLDIRGELDLYHTDVVVRGCRIGMDTATTLGVVNSKGTTGGTNVRLEYCEIIGPRGTGFVDVEGVRVFRTGVVVDRCDIHDTADGVIVVGGTQLTNSVIHDLHYESGAHADCVQCSSGTGWLVENCTLLAFNAPHPTGYTVDGSGVSVIDGGYPAHSNAAVQLGSQQGPISGTVRGCYMSGGNYTINANKVNEPTHGPIQVTYENNVFSGWDRFGPAAATGGGIVFGSSNTWEATRKTYHYSSATQAPNGRWDLTAGQPVSGTTWTGL